MNKNHSSQESTYRHRWVEHAFESAVHDFPVVVLTGARQTGKSTFLRHASPVRSWRYLTLDDYDVRRAADKDPRSLWAGADGVVIDEVQHSPALLSAVKMEVDETRGRTRFVLSGSANLLLMRRVSESLAGRAVYFTLFPMTLGEMEERRPPDILERLFRGEFPADATVEDFHDPFPAMARGFMPPLISLASPQSVVKWWEGYVATYLERDLRDISRIDSLADFRRVMDALALRNGCLLNQSEVARDVSVSQPTIHRYTNLLETTCLLERLSAFSSNRTKRLMKTPKLYWLDTGLTAYLSGIYDFESMTKSREKGAFFETFVLHHIKALAELMTPKARPHYWRTVTGREVDFVVEWGRNLLAFEVKTTATPRYADVEGLIMFIEEHPETRMGILVYNGPEIRRMGEKIVAVPWTVLAG